MKSVILTLQQIHHHYLVMSPFAKNI